MTENAMMRSRPKLCWVNSSSFLLVELIEFYTIRALFEIRSKKGNVQFEKAVRGGKKKLIFLSKHTNLMACQVFVQHGGKYGCMINMYFRYSIQTVRIKQVLHNLNPKSCLQKEITFVFNVNIRKAVDAATTN